MKQFFVTVWHWLTSPATSLQADEERRQARILASLTLFTLVGGFLLQILLVIFLSPQHQPGATWALLVSTPVFIGLYVLSRSRYYRFALYGIMVLLSGLIFLGAASRPEEVNVLVYLLVPVILSSLFLQWRTVIFVFLAQFAGILVLLQMQPQLNVPATWQGPIVFYCFATGFLVLGAYQQRKSEQLSQQREIERQKQLQHYFEQASDWIFMLDASGIVTYVNEQICRESGLSREELIGNPPAFFVEEEQADQINEMVQQMLAGKDIKRTEVELRLPDGRTIWLEVDGRIFTEDGNVTGTLHIGRDITERKDVERLNKKQRHLKDALHEAAVLLNSTLDPNQVLDRILEIVGHVVPYDGVNIILIEGEEARVTHCQGYYVEHGFADDVLNMKFPLSRTRNLQQMIQTETPMLIADTHNHPHWTVYPATKWVRSYVAAPILVGQAIIGFLNLDSAAPHFFDEDDARRLQAFAEQIAVALQNAHLYRKLQTINTELEKTVKDKTDELQRKGQQVSAVLNSSPDAIVFLGANGWFEARNPAFLDQFGLDHQHVEEWLTASFADTVERANFRQAWHKTINQGSTERLTTHIQTRQGTTYDVDIALAPVQSQDQVIGCVCSLRDISALKQSERLKDAFVENVSHELRTPIANLVLHHDLITRNPAKTEQYLDRIGREIKRLHILIENILQLSRLDQKQVALKPTRFCLHKLVSQYVQDRTPMAEANEIRLSLVKAPNPPPVKADVNLMGQVCSILLTNAINYTPPQGQITVRLLVQQGLGRERVGFSVQDSGPGIPVHEQSRVFDRFYRGKLGLSSGIPGTGLGLSIAQEIINRHQGQISLVSAGVPGEGTTFTVWLPASPADLDQEDSQDGQDQTE